ncbi:MAG: conjugal transfer protein TraG N-terminal domain-containing protein [Anaerohalosphaeraceae bacterium]|nr:conjugal transfer protein TraG N-terminal domain-containing protein [Anaerohalosphaeraceae bacterium]
MLKLIISLSALIALFASVDAYAEIPNALKTIKVYGELPYVVNAMERLALIMSDVGYQGLFFGIIIIMLVGGAIMFLITAFTRFRFSPVMWLSLFGMLFFGVIVYHAFIRNTSEILITDETMGGKFKAVAGVPDGVAFLAGLMNKIESGIVEIIWVAGDIEGFRDQSGGIGFSIINKAFAKKVDLSMIDGNGTGSYVNISLRRYIEDCFLFEVGRPGSNINVNDLNKTTDFMPALAAAASPAIFTVWHDAANPNGKSMSCRNNWNNHLKPYLLGLTAASPAVLNFWTQRCARTDLSQRNYAGFGGPAILDVCKNKVEGLITSLIGAGVTSNQLMRQYLIAGELDTVVREGTPDNVVSTVGSYRKGVDLVGAGIMLNEWLPIMKGIYYAIFLGLMPFLFLLIPTPLYSRALTFILGSFIFLTSWGICDAIIHSTAMDYAANTFREITEGKLGLKSMLMFENESHRAMAAFGAGRLMALSMAGVMSAMLVKFGGSAFAHMIHRSPISADSHGKDTAQISSAGDPVKRAGYERSISEAYPTQGWANTYSYEQRADAGTYRMTDKTESALQTSARFNGPESAGQFTGSASAMRAADGIFRNKTIQNIATASTQTPNDVQNVMQNYTTRGQYSRVQAAHEAADKLEMSIGSFLNHSGQTEASEKAGLIKGYWDARDHGYRGDFPQWTTMMKETETMSRSERAQSIGNYADQYYDGDRSAFLQDQVRYHQSELASMFSYVQKQGWTPEMLAAVKGRFNAVSEYSKYALKNNIGEKAEQIQTIGGVYKNLSNFAVDQAHAEIGKNGEVSKETGQLLDRIAQDPLGRQELSKKTAQETFTIGSDQAWHWARYINEHGGHVKGTDLSGKTVRLSSNYGNGFEMSVLDAKCGQTITHADYAKREIVDSNGHVTEWMDPNGRRVQSQLKTGPEIAPSDMLNAVIAKNDLLSNRISSAGTVAGRDTEEIVQAKALSQALSGIVNREGLSMTYVDSAGGGSLRAGALGAGANASASVGIGQRNLEKYNYNLYYGMIRRIQSEARHQAIQPSGTLDTGKYNRLYTQGVHELWNATDNLSHGKSDFSFGASSIVGAPWENYIRKPSAELSMNEQPSENQRIFRRKIHIPPGE